MCELFLISTFIALWNQLLFKYIYQNIEGALRKKTNNSYAFMHAAEGGDLNCHHMVHIQNEMCYAVELMSGNL